MEFRQFTCVENKILIPAQLNLSQATQITISKQK